MMATAGLQLGEEGEDCPTKCVLVPKERIDWVAKMTVDEMVNYLRDEARKGKR